MLRVISEFGPHQWEIVAETIDGRTGKQCRERWHNQLNPLLKRTPWSAEEDWVLFLLQKTKQNQWCHFKDYLVGRCDNTIKNYWNCTLRHRCLELEQLILRH